MEKWELYDMLIDGMDPSVKCVSVIVGQTWTEVLSDAGESGLAMTTPQDTRPRTRIDYNGMPLRELAELCKSWNFMEAGIGMAAINAFYNTKERMDRNGWEQKDARFCTGELDLTGKNVGMVGHLRHSGEEFRTVKNLFIMEMHPQEGDYPSSACEFLIPECDVVVITGSAFTNKTMPRLLELSENARVIVTGPSTPMAPVLLKEFPIDKLCGFIPGDKKLLHQYVSAGCISSPYRLGYRFSIVRS